MTKAALNRTICGFALLVLGGCAGPPPPDRAAPTPPAAAGQPIALIPPPPVKPPPPARRREARRAAPPASPPAAAPVRLVGLDEGAVQALLGQPTAVEDHAPGKTWRFRKRDCVLSLALYPDVQTRVFHTLSYEVTSDDHSAGAKQLCETRFGNLALAE